MLVSQTSLNRDPDWLHVCLLVLRNGWFNLWYYTLAVVLFVTEIASVPFSWH